MQVLTVLLLVWLVGGFLVGLLICARVLIELVLERRRERITHRVYSLHPSEPT